METTSINLSSNGISLVPFSQDLLVTVQQDLANYQNYSSSKQLSATADVEIDAKASHLKSLLEIDKNKALSTISELVSSANAITSSLKEALTSTPTHPYEQLVHQYLGPNFICPSISDITIPVDFTPQKCLSDLEIITNNAKELQTSHIAILSAELFDTSFPGITSENLNNSFAVLSSTSTGERYVVDSNKLSEHLKFIETFKRIDTDYVVNNPIEVAKKMLAEFIRIQK